MTPGLEGATPSRNVEIKARARAFEVQLQLAEGMCDSGPVRLDQSDRYFRTEKGRLKLRAIGDAPAELIYYERANATRPRESRYLIAPVEDPPRVSGILDAAYGTIAIVNKVRLLYLVGQTRIHFDRVDRLGDFIELEVVLREDQGVEEGDAVARGLMRDLGIEVEDLVAGSYLDLQKC